MKLHYSLISGFLIVTAQLGLASPYDLDIAAPVQIAGTDTASAKFQEQVLPDLVKVVAENLTLSQAASRLSTTVLDPGKLTLKGDATVRVYFVGEGAGNANTLGISTTGVGPLSADAALVFPNASSSAGWGGTERYGWAPLQAGDFVDLGAFRAGTKLDFFLISNGAYGGTEVLSANASDNRDGLVHAVALAQEGSTYLLMGFEDIFGEGFDRFNDLAFAVEITPAHSPIAAPEPTLALGGAVACLAFLCTRRRSTV